MRHAGYVLLLAVVLPLSAISRRFALLFFSVLISASLWAQTVRFDQLSTEEGLPDATILCILKDRQGFLWVGTYGGVARYDGYSFKAFAEDPRDPQSLRGNIIYAMIEDREGFLWMGSVGKGLSRFDPITETFIHFQHDPQNPKSLSHNDVYALYEDQSGNLWVGTRGGLDLLDRRTREFRHIHPHASEAVDHRSLQITAIFEDPSAPGA